MRDWLKFFLCSALSLAIAAEPALAQYRAASAFFARRDYISAASGYFQGMTSPHAPGERELSEWGLAQSLQRLGFYYSASKYYSVIVRRGPSAQNQFFTKALEELGKINSTVNLGQSHVVQLFKTRIDPSQVPGPARGFYFYYLGIEAFNKRKFEQAAAYFQQVPSSSPYYLKSTFHLGVVANLRGNHSGAITYFEKARSGAAQDEAGAWVREQANLNIARVNYEVKRYRTAIESYAQIPRESDNWLEALFEAAWTFFMMQKHNNTLGTIHTIHSPFFENRFFPESYILQAITFLRLCRYKQVKISLAKFKTRYKGVFDDLAKILDKYGNDPKGFFKLVYDYRSGSLSDYKRAFAILDSLARTDVYKEAGNTIRFADRELARLASYNSRWGSTGLQDELSSFLRNKKTAAVGDAGKRLFDKATGYYAYLKELSDQTIGINTEMVLGRVDRIREQLNVGTADKKSNFIGGLSELKVGEDLEFWPFEGEYWEDELGGYVYNLDSMCGKGAPAAKAGKPGEATDEKSDGGAGANGGSGG